MMTRVANNVGCNPDRHLRSEHSRVAVRNREAQKYDREYFASHYWAEDLPGRSGNRGLSYDDPDHSLRFRLISDLLQRSIEFGTVLDAGCGLGGVLANLRGSGKMIQGCDISEYAVSACASKGVPCVKAGLHHLPFSSSAFDLVFCSDVLEHLIVEDALDAVSELTRVARKHLVLTINLDNPYNFHPTILSRDSWMSLFLRTGELLHNSPAEARLSDHSRARPEYEWFVFSRRN